MNIVDLNQSYPVLASQNVVIFPGRTVPLRIGRPGSVKALENALEARGKYLLIVAQKEASEGNEVDLDNLYHVGTIAHVEKAAGSAGSGYQVIARGSVRVRISRFFEKDGFIQAEVQSMEDQLIQDAKVETALLQNIRLAAHEILKLIPADTRQLEELVDGIEDLNLLVSLCAENIEVTIAEKQSLLEEISLEQRAIKLLDLMNQQRESLSIQADIREKVAKKFGKGQREAMLREQMRAIQEELGETQTKNDYRDKIEIAKLPDDVSKLALEEARRLEAIGNSSPEAHVIRNYLDLLLAMPWNEASDSLIDIEAARQVLENEHYGIKQVKQRIIQHLSVMKLRADKRGSILLLVGPPGVGKTSLGESIARAMGRKFVRASLGGVRDDAEIRGHRRTYIGAMPGRIVQGLKRAGVNNPVFMLDEIDKLGRGYQGDPAAAMLEVLDPEQNHAFTDHYLDVPFDLSHCFFIATANSLESIPGPLLDRMEVIKLSGYTSAEKLHIAKNHLISRQLKEHGLTAEQAVITDEALIATISKYTREAGVRELQRMIATIFRWSTEKVLSAKPEELPIRISTKDLEDSLGPVRYEHEVAERVTPPGVVTGLAWTPMGGDILFVEASQMPGTGQINLTGQLGEVMKESAHIALSLVRSRLPELVPDLAKKDLHLHVPAGAIPKDGPSAGITLFTALASLFAGRPVSPKTAMTGEVSLRGVVLPVGGIKEKVIAAHRSGIQKIILSRRNERDLKEVPDEVRSVMEFVLVDTVADVLMATIGFSTTAWDYDSGRNSANNVESTHGAMMCSEEAQLKRSCCK
jgi:ATP-dependent Lon protease